MALLLRRIAARAQPGTRARTAGSAGWRAPPPIGRAAIRKARGTQALLADHTAIAAIRPCPRVVPPPGMPSDALPSVAVSGACYRQLSQPETASGGSVRLRRRSIARRGYEDWRSCQYLFFSLLNLPNKRMEWVKRHDGEVAGRRS